jgi:ribonuclease E
VYLRQIQTGVTRKHVKTVQCLLPLEVGKYLLNKKRAELNELEKRHNTSIIIETEANLSSSQASIKFLKE